MKGQLEGLIGILFSPQMIKIMKEKIYEPARHNETSPSKGMAAVNTHMPEETPLEETKHEEAHDQRDKKEKREEERPASN